MSSEFFSIIVQYRHTSPQSTTQLQVMRVDTAEIVPINDCSFLVCFSRDKTAVERYLIRHLTSGCEVYLQSGSGLSTFIKACVLHTDGSKPTALDTPGE